MVDNDGFHGATTKSGSVTLPKGWSKILITFFEQSGVAVLKVSVRFPGEKSYVRLSHTHTTPYESESDHGCAPGGKAKHECGRQCSKLTCRPHGLPSLSRTRTRIYSHPPDSYATKGLFVSTTVRLF